MAPVYVCDGQGYQAIVRVMYQILHQKLLRTTQHRDLKNDVLHCKIYRIKENCPYYTKPTPHNFLTFSKEHP